MKTLLVNGRYLTQTVTGVQRYCIELMRQLDALLSEPNLSSKLRIACLAPSAAFARPGWKNIQLRTIGFNRGNLWEQVDLPFYLKGNLLFSPANIGPWHYRNQIVMVHDASVFAVPDAYSLAFRAKYVFILRQLVRRARVILTNSNFSKAELSHHLRAPNGHFNVIPLGADHLDHVRPDEKVLHRNHLEERSYFLLVASLSPHKNIERVLAAVKLLTQDVRIVIVGDRSNRRVFREPAHTDLPPNIRVLGFLEDQELRALYENALGLIFPSNYEGFGLPVLEAMRCGCPVICANSASLPEVAADAALYFNPLDTQDLAETIDSFLHDPALQEELRQKGYRRSAGYTWDRTARKTLEIFLAALTD